MKRVDTSKEFLLDSVDKLKDEVDASFIFIMDILAEYNISIKDSPELIGELDNLVHSSFESGYRTSILNNTFDTKSNVQKDQ